MHYSPSAEAYNRSRKEVQQLAKDYEAKKRTLASLRSKPNVSRDVVDAAIRTLTSEIEVLKKDYEVSVAIYRESNIHARRDEIDGSHPALQAPPMEVEYLGKFDDFYAELK